MGLIYGLGRLDFIGVVRPTLDLARISLNYQWYQRVLLWERKVRRSDLPGVNLFSIPLHTML